MKSTKAAKQDLKKLNELMRDLFALDPLEKAIDKKLVKPKAPRRRILCKVKSSPEDYSEGMIVYRDGTWRWESDRVDDVAYWKLAHSDLGPIFLYKSNNDPDSRWETDWKSDDQWEIKIATKIAEALTDIEMEKILKGKDDVKPTKTDNNPS